jgi:hypothetical protein
MVFNRRDQAQRLMAFGTLVLGAKLMVEDIAPLTVRAKADGHGFLLAL